jgi:hypothetical protein
MDLFVLSPQLIGNTGTMINEAIKKCPAEPNPQ